MGILDGKVALVTGGGSGLGRATAIGLAEEGAAIVLCGRRSSKITDVQAEIEALGGTAEAVVADVTSPEQIAALANFVRERFNRLDILINNAAVFIPGNGADTSLEDWNTQIQTNLTGPFLVTQAFLPLMRKQKYGRIVNITSSLAQNGADGFIAYAASKAGLESFTRSLAEEEEKSNILVNLFNPGTVKTEMHATGRDPREAVPDLIRLVSLPDGGMSGRLVEAGHPAV